MGNNFIEKAKIMHKDKYDYSLVKYVNAKTKIKIICLIHGEFMISPEKHLSGGQCQKCSGKYRPTTNEFIERVKLIHKDKYNYSTVDYINSKTKINIICPLHGNFKQTPSTHILGKGCNKCGIESTINLLKKDKINFISESNIIHNNKYDYSSIEYVNSKTNIKIVCPIHGEFNQRPNNHLKGKGCKQCASDKQANKLNIGLKEFIKRAKVLHGKKYGYDLVLSYKNNRTKLEIKCEKHGVFKQTPQKHLKNQGCPKCKESKGEKEITNYLNENKINFIPQYKFLECKNLLPLPFDFYLPNYNICIEYDGEQHFNKFRFEKNEMGLLRRQNNDKIKTNYCLNNNIYLLRIKYNECIIKALKTFFN
jgi:hypothetical protein